MGVMTKFSCVPVAFPVILLLAELLGRGESRRVSGFKDSTMTFGNASDDYNSEMEETVQRPALLDLDDYSEINETLQLPALLGNASTLVQTKAESLVSGSLKGTCSKTKYSLSFPNHQIEVRYFLSGAAEGETENLNCQGLEGAPVDYHGKCLFQCIQTSEGRFQWQQRGACICQRKDYCPAADWDMKFAGEIGKHAMTLPEMPVGVHTLACDEVTTELTGQCTLECAAATDDLSVSERWEKKKRLSCKCNYKTEAVAAQAVLRTFTSELIKDIFSKITGGRQTLSFSKWRAGFQNKHHIRDISLQWMQKTFHQMDFNGDGEVLESEFAKWFNANADDSSLSNGQVYFPDETQ